MNNQNNLIQEYLEELNTLSEIARVMYGDVYVLQKDFWGSPTEKEIYKVYKKLDMLGYEPDITEEQKALGEIIFRGLIDNGTFKLDEEDDD